MKTEIIKIFKLKSVKNMHKEQKIIKTEMSLNSIMDYFLAQTDLWLYWSDYFPVVLTGNNDTL
jgi:hypothetical protein